VVKAAELGSILSVKGVSKVLICGVGGSALPGDFIKSLFHPLKFELSVVKDYTIPKFVNQDYLCFCISYSGNTEETVTAYKRLIKDGRKVVVVTSGGELERLSKKNNNLLIKVPKGLQPRMAVPYLTLPVLNVIVNSGIIKYDLSKQVSKVRLDYDFEKIGKEIAAKIKGTIPLIYSSTRNYILSEKWKISFNENSKTPAFFNHFPEWNHNEINCFKNTECEFTAVMLMDDKDYKRIKKRFEITSRILKSNSVEVLKVRVEEKNRLGFLLTIILLGDWVSYELARLYKQDPEKVPIIEELKKELKASG
jgi:glucose/mannose-6-phosphate isomerase